MPSRAETPSSLPLAAPVDIHPPLVKLIYAGVLKAQGFVGPQERKVKWWSDKGNIIGTSDHLKVFDKAYGAPYIAMRVTSAVAGAALIPATYLSARALGLGRVPALLAAVLMLTETVSALQVRGRALRADAVAADAVGDSGAPRAFPPGAHHRLRRVDVPL